MEVTCLGVALRQIIPRIIGEGLSSWWELVKPLVEFRWDVIQTRLNSMFELATQEEVNNESNQNPGCMGVYMVSNHNRTQASGFPVRMYIMNPWN